MYNTLATALVTLLTYMLIPASPTYQLTVIALAILYGTTFIFTVKFLPKVMQIRHSYHATTPLVTASDGSHASRKASYEDVVSSAG